MDTMRDNKSRWKNAGNKIHNEGEPKNKTLPQGHTLCKY